jgi:2-dehydropantoate 2-reductase
MKILVFGAGVIGSYYAAKLYQSKIDVSILARGEKFRDINDNGVVIEDFFTGEQTVSRIRVIDKPDHEAYDLVMVTIQMVHINYVLPVLSQFTNAKSFLFVGNNVNGFENISKHLGPSKLLAGFGAIGGKRNGHKVFYADADPKRPNKKIPLVVGKVNAFSNQEFNKIKQLFEGANINVQVEDDVDGWLKTHVAMILGLASAAYKKDYNLKSIANDKELVKLIVKALRESMKVLKSLGITIVPKRNRYLQLLPGFFLEFVFRKLLYSEYAEIALTGHAMAARAEMRALADGFLVHCRKSNVDYGAFKKLTDYI